MRLVPVETFRLYVGAPDTAAVKAKLVQYLDEATVHLEQRLGISLEETAYEDVFYLPRVSPRTRMVPIYLRLTGMFLSGSPAPTVAANSGPCDFTVGEDLESGCYELQSIAGLVKVLTLGYNDKHIKVDYTAGFASEAEGSYDGTVVASGETVPEPLVQAYLMIARQVREQRTGADCDDSDDCSHGAIPPAAEAMLARFDRDGPLPITPL